MKLSGQRVRSRNTERSRRLAASSQAPTSGRERQCGLETRRHPNTEERSYDQGMRYEEVKGAQVSSTTQARGKAKLEIVLGLK